MYQPWLTDILKHLANDTIATNSKKQVCLNRNKVFIPYQWFQCFHWSYVHHQLNDKEVSGSFLVVLSQIKLTVLSLTLRFFLSKKK